MTTATVIERAKKIRLALFDVDGVLTTGNITYSDTGTELKSFHVHDGLGLKLLQKAGITVGIITARNSPIVTKRMKNLGIEHVYQGVDDKVVAYEALKQKLNLTDEQVAYTGDDLPDLPVIHRVGLSITVANANPLIRQYAHWTTTAKGGKGAAREISEFILQAQGHYERLMQDYINR